MSEKLVNSGRANADRPDQESENMFRENASHGESQMSSSLEALPDKVRERLEQSWAGTFYREYFCRIDEEAFAVLYAETPSRPNTPVNVLVGLDVSLHKKINIFRA